MTDIKKSSEKQRWRWRGQQDLGMRLLRPLDVTLELSNSLIQFRELHLSTFTGLYVRYWHKNNKLAFFSAYEDEVLLARFTGLSDNVTYQ